MSATQIYIASAGSGKTFTLVREYLTIVFSEAQRGNFYAYRQILAITFTNKATLEMKQRIIAELKNIALVKESDQLPIIKKQLPDLKDPAQLADRVLVNLLHDYSNFNIRTIDSFFQDIIKAFARELGLPMNYEIIMDSDEGIEFAVNILMDLIGKDKMISKWLEEYAYSQIDNEKGWDFRKIVTDLSKEIFNNKSVREIRDDSSKSRASITLKEINRIKDKLDTVIKNYETSIAKHCQKVLELLEQSGLPFGVFNKGLHDRIKLGAKGNPFDFTEPQKVILSGDKSPFSKVNLKKYAGEIARLDQSGTFSMLSDIHDIITKKGPLYFTYKAIYKHIYGVAVVDKVNQFLTLYREQNNALFLLDAAKLINGFIHIEETPFLFEKLASQIQYLFIDEFQDTSQLQWDNLQPILVNILSSSEKPLQVLIVGDAKQSIYRFRGGDYRLLTSGAAESLPFYDDDPIILKENWRSLSSVVDFNNTFFEMMVSISGQAGYPGLQAIIEDAYRSLRQQCMKHDAIGKVSMTILSNTEKDWEERALEKMMDDLIELESTGYRRDQIAILVNKKKDGIKISEYLYRQPGNYEIVSQETLLLKNDATIKLILAALYHLHQPEEGLYYVRLTLLLAEKQGVEVDQNTLIIDHKNRSYLKEFCPTFYTATEVNQHLLDYFETICSLFDVNVSGDLYVSHFKQLLINFYKNQSSSLSDFLEWWEEEEHKKAVVVEDSRDKIKVMTIHKSKGLEFPVVLIPFCTWDFFNRFHESYLWLKEDTLSNDLEFPVKLTKGIGQSNHAELFEREVNLNWLDNVNKLYVAFTRAKEVLIVTSYFSSNSEKNNKISSANKIMNAILTEIGNTIEKTTDFSIEYGNYDHLPLPEKEDADNGHSYQLSKTADRHRTVAIRKEFSSSEINVGKLVHQALFYYAFNDAPTAFSKATIEAPFNDDVISDAKNHFFNLISDKSQYGQWLENAIQTWDEQALYHDGKEMRPDKIIQLNDRYIIIDYKTGVPQNKYIDKMRLYMDALTSTGIKERVDGYILYTENGKLEPVL